MALSLVLAAAPGFADVVSTPPCLPAVPQSPLGSIDSPADISRRLLSGGGWLAGLPGYPRYNGTHVHAGIDLAAPLGDPIYALVPGVVDPTSDVPHSGYGPGWTTGRVMIARSTLPDGTPFLVVYGHTQNHRVKGGDTVKAGDMLAEVGPWLDSEGGPHLHLTVRLGELPRFGWGTPTLAGKPCRDGAESVACEADVLRLGYRNPALLLLSQGLDLPAEPSPDLTVDFPSPVVPSAAADALKHFADMCRTFASRLPPASRQMLPLKPVHENVLKTSQPSRWGRTWTQTFRTATGDQGALIWPDGDEQLYWVGGRLWQAYAEAGGPKELGPPCSEQYDWGDCVAQSFTKALVVCEPATDRTRVIFRPLPGAAPPNR
jgi:murein DD-endopeptidase MepM/ murein hydrolase activator NlpD